MCTCLNIRAAFNDKKGVIVYLSPVIFCLSFSCDACGPEHVAMPATVRSQVRVRCRNASSRFITSAENYDPTGGLLKH